MRCEAQLAYSCPLLGVFFGGGEILTCNVGQTDMVFWHAIGFISKSDSVHARLQNNTCKQRLQFVAPWLTSTHTDSILTSLYESLSQLN